MNGWLSRGALLATLAFILSACGGSNSNDPVAAPGNGGNGGGNGQPVLTIVDTSNEFSLSFCPNTASLGTIGDVIDRIACENEALQGIGAGDADLLGRFCPVAAEDFAVINAGDEGISVLPLDFGPACLMETADTLQNIQDLIGGSNPLTALLCPMMANSGEFDPAGCFAEAVDFFSDFEPPRPTLLVDILGELCPTAALGPLGPTTPVDCLTEIGGSLANAQELLLGPNLITEAVCPVAAFAPEFDPAECITETLGAFIPGGGGGFDGIPGFDQIPGIGDLCEEGADPLSCLLAAGDALAPLTDLLGDIPVLGDILAAILGGGDGEPGEGGPDIPEFPGFGDCDPADPASCLAALTELLAPISDLIGEVPVLGDIINALLSGELPDFPPGGGDGGLPEFPGFGDACDPTDPASCLAALTELLAPLNDLLDNVPVLGDIINGILSGELPEFPGGGDGGDLPAFPGFGDCDPADPMSCLAALTDLLSPLTGALEQIPVLGDIVNGILSGELPEFPGGGDGGLPEFPGFDACDPADPASCLGALTDLLAPLTGALEQIPVLGDIVNGLLAGEVPDFPGFPGGGDGGFPELPGFDACDPADPASCLEALAGLADLLAPLTGLLEEIPVLGDLIVGLLSGELPDFPGGDGGLPGGDFGDFCDPADPASCLALLTDALAPVTDGLSAIPVLGDVLGTLLGAVEGGDTSGIEDIPVLGAILGPIFGFLP